MRFIAGFLLFVLTVAGAYFGVTAQSGRAADSRFLTDPDAPIAAGRPGEDDLLAAMAYETPVVQPSGRRLADGGMELLGEGPSRLPAVSMAFAQRQPPTGPKAAFNAPASRRPIEEAGLDVKEILLRIGPSREDRKKGRWFVFAAGSGDAFGLNLIRDGEKGLRRAGWSMEKLAEFGKAQIGVGWRRGPTQVSLAASRREIGAYGVSQEDTVVGVSVSVKP